MGTIKLLIEEEKQKLTALGFFCQEIQSGNKVLLSAEGCNFTDQKLFARAPVDCIHVQYELWKRFRAELNFRK